MWDVNEGGIEDLQMGRAHSSDLIRARTHQYLSLQSTVSFKDFYRLPVYCRSTDHSKKNVLKD